MNVELIYRNKMKDMYKMALEELDENHFPQL